MTLLAVHLPREEAYSSFCSVDVRHDFCVGPDNAFSGFSLAPGPETESRLREWGVLFRPRDDGFDLICDSGRWGSLEAMLEAITAGAPGGLPADLADTLLGPPLLFVATLADPLFLNFTDVPVHVSIGAPILWLSNRNVDDGGSEPCRLTIDWSRPAHLPAGPPVPPSPSEILGSDFGIERDSWAATRRDMLLGAEEAERLRKAVTHRPLAVVAIFPSGKGAEPVYLGSEGNRARKLRYVIHFAARSSHWRYIVAGRRLDFAGGDYAIVDPLTYELAGFEKGQDVVLPDGRSAMTFVSLEPRLTVRHASPGLALHRVSGTPARRQVAIPCLPVPGPDTPVASGANGKLYSDIYVFV